MALSGGAHLTRQVIGGGSRYLPRFRWFVQILAVERPPMNAEDLRGKRLVAPGRIEDAQDVASLDLVEGDQLLRQIRQRHDGSRIVTAQLLGKVFHGQSR